MNNPHTSRKSGRGILTGGRNLLTGSQFFSTNSRYVDKEDDEGSRTPSFVQKSESEKSEYNSELMQYLSQVNTIRKSTKRTINWDIMDDLNDTHTLSGEDLEDSPEKVNYFLKPKKPVVKDTEPTYGNEDRVPNMVDPQQDSNNSHSSKTDANSTKYSDQLKITRSDTTSEGSSLSLEHGALKERIFSLDELGVDSSGSQSIENNGIKSHSVGSVNVDFSLSHTNYIVDKINGEKEDQECFACDSSVHTSLAVSEDLETNEASIKQIQTNGEDVYSDKFEEITSTVDSSIFSLSNAVETNTQKNGSIEEGFKWNVISKLSSLDGSGKSDSLAVTSVDYTMDFDSSENQSKGSETTLCHQSSSQKSPHELQNVMDACTQTLVGTENILGFHSEAAPTVSLGPPKFSTNYHNPPPVVLPADTLDVLTAYSPNMVALNDILRSQLVLTRQLLDTNRVLLNSLTSSLKPDYQYTTLEDTRQYIQDHRPKILTLSEATKRTRHKRN